MNRGSLWSMGPLAVVLIACSSGVAHAQRSDDDRAREHFEAGISYYEQSRYEDAEREFLESHRLSRRAALLVNIATVRERRLDFTGAAQALERYLEDAPDAEDRVTIESRAQALRRQAGEVATREERPDDAPSSPPIRDSRAPTTAGTAATTTAGIAVLIGAGVLGGATLATGIGSQVIHDDLVQACGADRVCPPERRDDASTGEALSITSTVTLVATGVAAGVGIVLLLLDGGSGEASAGQGRWTPGPGEVGLAYELSF